MEVVQIAEKLQKTPRFPAVLCTLVQVEGSSYRRPGARLLIESDGTRTGSISGGCLETDLVARAQSLLTGSASSEVAIYDTTDENDLLWGVGTGCHGVVTILLEKLSSPPAWSDAIRALGRQRRSTTLVTRWQGAPAVLGTRQVAETAPTDVNLWVQTLRPPWHLVVFGAGDDAQPLVAMAANLDWQTTVVDPRPEMATASRFPRATAVHTLPTETVVAQVQWDDRTVAVIMTHHYRYDLPLLRALLPLHLPFLGLLGPRERAQRILADAGFDPAGSAAARLHAPVGLDLGGDGAEAVALSILAEIQSSIHQRDARPLHLRATAIHS